MFSRLLQELSTYNMITNQPLNRGHFEFEILILFIPLQL